MLRHPFRLLYNDTEHRRPLQPEVGSASDALILVPAMYIALFESSARQRDSALCRWALPGAGAQ